MFDISTEQVVILLTIVALISATRRFRRLGGRDEASRHLEDLRRRMPAFSAETTRGKEAEFIRDSLPRQFPYIVLLLAAAMMIGTVIIWWLGR